MASGSIDVLRETLAAQGVTLDGSATSTIGISMSFDEALASISDLPVARLGASDEQDLVVVGELGRGGMGIVLLARQRALAREVAVKRCHEREGDTVQALVREARITGSLEHPNVIPVHALLADDEGPAVVMKRVIGASWEDRLDDPDLSLERSLEIFGQLCNAVAYAHSKGVVHRDIKPENVLLGEYGEVYLADWGLARKVDDPPAERIAGSPAYMAPEMLAGEADERTDVYLLGATLHQVVTGQTRHRGPLGDAIESVRRSNPFVYPASVPEDLATILNRACHAKPDQRFQSVQDLQAALRAHVRLRGTRGLVETAEERSAELEARSADGELAPREADQLFTEARFGFEQALSEVSEAAVGARAGTHKSIEAMRRRAAEGRQRLLEQMARIELDRRQPDAALALLGAMDEAPAALREEAEALRDQLDADRERLSVLEADRDPRVGAGARSWAQLLLAGGILTVTLLFAVIFAPRRDPSPERLAVVGCVVFAVIATVALVWRRRGEWNLVNRRIAQIAVLASAVSALQRLVALVTHAAAVHVLMTDAFLLGMAGMALTPFHRAGPVLTVLSLGVILTGIVSPGLVDEVFVGFAVGVPFVLLLRQSAKRLLRGGGR